MTRRSPERAAFLSGVISHAVEGGVNYWAEVSGYAWHDGAGGIDAAAQLVEREAGGGEPFQLTADAVARGLGEIRRGGVPMRSDIAEAIAEADRSNDAGVIDAEAADVIAQAAMFGAVVYG